MEKNKKQKLIIRVAGMINLVKIIVVAVFLIYLYFWIKRNN